LIFLSNKYILNLLKENIYFFNLLKDGILHNEGNFLNFEKMRKKKFTTYEGKNLISKMQKFFDFENWTKINVQKPIAQKVLTEKFFKMKKDFYRHKINHEKLFVIEIFSKKYLKIKSESTLWGH
jgi:hypothetical protein